ncbi:MAG: [LysW]-lysine hydrolase [Chloroflexota bacterium]
MRVGTTQPRVEGPSGAAVTILGHMDTVPGWVSVEERDRKIYGRGAVDAKGPLATAVVAAARARTRARITVIGAVEEEASSTGARHLAAMKSPDFLIIAEPSGADAVVLGYKGSQRFQVEWSQPCAHSAGQEPTAPERTMVFWNALTAWCAARCPDRGNAFRQLTPRLLGMESHSDGLHEQACLNVGLRLPPETTVEEVRAGVQDLWPEASFAFAPAEQPVLAGKGTPLVAAFLRSIRARGAKPRFKVKTGTSDMNVVAPVWRCPMVAYGPGDSSLDHTPEEHVGVDEYLAAIHVLTAVLEEL